MIIGKIKETTEEITIKTVKNCPDSYDATERVLLIDSDSITYYATYFPEDSLIFFPDEDAQIEEAKFRVQNKIQEIQNNVEEYFNIKQTLLFVGGRNNFRYKIFSDYKANRKKAIKSPLLPIIKEYMVTELGAIESHNGEADDYLTEAAMISQNKCIISAIDKDIIAYNPNIPIYDYRSYNDVLGEFKYITEKESRLARVTQLISGDASDGVPGAKNMGKAYCEKNLHQDMSNYQFIKAVYIAYLKANKNDSIEAKRQIRMYYLVLKLHTQEDINKILKKYDSNTIE